MEVISRVGDICAEDYGGGAIVKDDGYFWLEYTHGLESDHPGVDQHDEEALADLKLELFRVQLDESAWEALTGCGDPMKLWEGIAESVGQHFVDVLHLATSREPKQIAGAFEMFAGHYGWRELDHYPIQVSYKEVETRWGD